MQLVKFSFFHDFCDVCRVDKPACCRRACTQIAQEVKPCTPHPRGRGLLHHITAYNDRPHLARWELYTTHIFGLIAPNTRTTMEHIASHVAKSDRAHGHPWGLWVYGERGRMKHDHHIAPSGNGTSYNAITGAHSAITIPGRPHFKPGYACCNQPARFAHPVQ